MAEARDDADDDLVCHGVPFLIFSHDVRSAAFSRGIVEFATRLPVTIEMFNGWMDTMPMGQREGMNGHSK